MIYREEKQPQIPVNHCAWCGSYDLGTVSYTHLTLPTTPYV